MIIYGSLIIPLITAFILYKFYHRHVTWWEFFIPVITSLVLTFTMKAIIEKVQVTSKEYWGSMVDRVEYYESWNEYIHQTCTRQCCCNSKGENCSTETYDCSYVSYHSAYWQIISTTGEVIAINEKEYNSIKSKLGNESFVDMKRNYHTEDGDMYLSKWNRSTDSAIPVTTVHSYENRVKAADQSVFHFGEVSKADVKKYGLKEYPKIISFYKMQSVIGDSSKDALIADQKIQYLNGMLGHKKQVRVFVLIFKNQPIEAGLYQEWYWSGANMNEFVICIGIDNNRNVKWCKPISWTKNEYLKTSVKSFVQSQKELNLQSIANYTHNEVEKQFVRRSFKEFDYLTVEPPTWAVILTYILTIIANILVSIWVVKNEKE